MTWQKHAKHSLLGALVSVLRRARPSLYQPGARALSEMPRVEHLLTAQQPPRRAKIIPFPQTATVPNLTAPQSPHVGLR